MDPGADSWTTVDRKVTKKKTKDDKPAPEGQDEGWSQVGKDRRKKDPSDRRPERRGDNRGRPPMRGGGFSNRNTLPRKPGGASGVGRDGRGSGREDRRGARNTTSPAIEPVPVVADIPVENPQEAIPVKSSWATLVSNKVPPGSVDSVVTKVESVVDPSSSSKDSTKVEPVLDFSIPVKESATLKVEPVENANKETNSAKPSDTSISIGETDAIQATKVDNSTIAEPAPTLSNLNSVPINESSSIVNPTVHLSNQPTNKAELQTVESCSSSPSQNSKSIENNVEKNIPRIVDSCVDKPIKHESPAISQSPDSKLDTNDAVLPVNKGGDLDPNGNDVTVDANKNINLSKMTMEEIVSRIDPETRQYDRDILLQLQQHPLSLQKPDKLPELEIVLDTPLRSSSSAPVLGENPSQYVHNFTRAGMPPKRDSRRKETSKKVISLSREPVKLHKAENAWSAGNKGGGEETAEDESLVKKVRAILNKLTPQKFDTLVVKFKEIEINTEAKLIQCMELVFEKALDEPSFSKAYASMCRELYLKKVDSVDFLNLLLRRCQKEFLQDYMSDKIKAKYAEDLAAADSEDDKKRVKAEFQQKETKLRRRSLGNIKFIGELYKLNLLRGRIMHSIIKQLLTAVDEESLECLCQLLTTCGAQIEAEVEQIPLEHRSAYSFVNYFNQMRTIIDEKKTSSRVRFLLQDVIDLRSNNWVSRRKEAGPKTIQEIHKEAKLEALRIQLADQKPDPPVGRRSEERNRRKTEYRPKPRPEEGWSNVPTRAAKMSDIVDPDRFRLIQKIDPDQLQLGPSTGHKLWGAGSSSNRSEDTKISVNRFQMLEDVENPAPVYSGRASEPVFNRTNRARRDNKPASQDTSRDQSLDHALKIALRGPINSDPDILRSKYRTLLEEFINNCDFNETFTSICELFNFTNMNILSEETFNLGLEKKSVGRERCGLLLTSMMQRDCLNVDQLVEGLVVMLEVAGDIIIDIPKFWDLMADVLAPVLVDRGCFAVVVERCFPQIEDDKMKVDFVSSLLRAAKNVRNDKFIQLIKQNKETLERLLKKDVAVYLEEINLDVSEPAEASLAPADLVNGNLQEDLFKKLSTVFSRRQTGNDEMSSVDAILCDKMIDRETVKTVVTAVIESVVDGIGGPSVHCSLNEETMKGRVPILKKYIDADKDRELYALFAIQSVVHKLEHPNKLLHRILEYLYDNECISEDGLFDWEKSDDPEEQEGKGVALKSCTQLFNWLKTAEEDEVQAA